MNSISGSKGEILISIIILAKDQGWKIYRAVSSIIQTANVEIVIIEPGSTDNSREVVSNVLRINSNIITPIYTRDSGPPQGLNNGLRVASGEVIGFLNADDFYLPGALDQVRNRFIEDCELDLYLGSGFIIDERSLKIKKQISTEVTKYHLALSALGGFTLFQQGMFFRKSSFPNVQFNEKNQFAWDFEFVADLTQHEPKTLIDRKVIACFVLHDKSISGSGKFAKAYDDWKISFAEQILDRELRYYDYLIALFLRLKKFIASRSLTL